MKKLFITVLTLLLITSCGKKEEKFEAFSTEAFAYDLGGSWEVNATVRIKGFNQIVDKETGNYAATISLVVDLVKPDSTVEKAKFSYVHSETSKEKISDVGLEAQFELDSTYQEGNYKIIFHIKDANSDNQTSIETDLELSK
ncbi:MAG: hypothetical protein N3D80_02215 [Ignavibacterium album]|uniref:hypothetical protein n=1 Tax=Ignavibacterium album TaxID=591197 RepID=UPI0026EFF036|nr:hypothetical protein [Ignavibacterium album]MCX8104671.1 hypothetical protein [Ignavibacterium album]